MLLDIHEPGQSPLPHESVAAIGIDLGTTNSVVAVSQEGRPEVIRSASGEALIPSVVAYGEDGSVSVGEAAREQLLADPTHVVGSIKRLMGRGLDDVKALAGALPYEVEVPADGAGGMVRLVVAGCRLSRSSQSSRRIGSITHITTG